MIEHLGVMPSKLRVPKHRNNLLPRDNLYKTLAQLEEQKLILVRGVAGSGKTTLAASFVSNRLRGPLAWVSLDDSMDNVYTFWTYVISALVDAKLIEGRELVQVLNGSLSTEEVISVVLQILRLLEREEDVYLVFDDFQCLRDPVAVQSMEFFVKNSSDNLHLLILSREDLPFYTADILMEGRLLEIGDESLKVSPEESILFLREVMGVSQPEEILQYMSQLAEGWIGGLQLLAVAQSIARGNRQTYTQVARKYLSEYLSKEIVSALSEEEQDFLTRTSFLGYFDAGVVNELLNINHAERIIDSLLERNLFIVATEGDYRYHSIFGEFLKQRFGQLPREEQEILQAKAAKILKSKGNLEGCLELLFKLGRYREMLEIIRNTEDSASYWPSLVKIPIEYIVTDPDAVVQRAFYHFANTQWEKSFELARALADRNDPLSTMVKRFTEFLQEGWGGENDSLSLQALEGMNLKDSTKSIACIKLVVLLQLQDRYHEAISCLTRAMELNKTRANPWIKYFITLATAQANEEVGNLNRCHALYNDLDALVKANPAMSHLIPSTRAGRAGVLIKQMELEQAEEHLASLLGDSSMRLAIYQAAYALGRLEVLLLRGKRTEAQGLFEQIGSVGYENSPLLSALAARYLFYLPDPNRARAFLPVEPFGAIGEYEKIDIRLARVRLLILDQAVGDALTLLDSIIKQARKERLNIKLVESILLKLRLLLARGADASVQREIVNLLREAVNYSYRDRIMHLYVLDAEIVKPILPRLKERMGTSFEKEEHEFIHALQESLGISGATSGGS